MGTELNIFTKTKNKLSSYPLFLATVTSSNHRHYCLSLARLNDMKIKNSASVPWTKLESASILFKGEDKVIVALR